MFIINLLVSIMLIFSLLVAFIGLYFLSRRLYLLYKKTNIGIIPYSELFEEVLTIWFFLIVVLYSIYTDFYFLAYLVGSAAVLNWAKHIYEAINYKKIVKQKVVDVFYQKPRTSDYLDESAYKKDHIQFYYNVNAGLRKITLTEQKENEAKDLIALMREDKEINNYPCDRYRKELIRNWVYIGLLLVYLITITSYFFDVLR